MVKRVSYFDQSRLCVAHGKVACITSMAGETAAAPARPRAELRVSMQLWIAAKNGDSDGILRAIDAGADIHSRDPGDVRPT